MTLKRHSWLLGSPFSRGDSSGAWIAEKGQAGGPRPTPHPPSTRPHPLWGPIPQMRRGGGVRVSQVTQGGVSCAPEWFEVPEACVSHRPLSFRCHCWVVPGLPGPSLQSSLASFLPSSSLPSFQRRTQPSGTPCSASSIPALFSLRGRPPKYPACWRRQQPRAPGDALESLGLAGSCRRPARGWRGCSWDGGCGEPRRGQGRTHSGSLRARQRRRQLPGGRPQECGGHADTHIFLLPGSQLWGPRAGPEAWARGHRLAEVLGLADIRSPASQPS